MAGVADSGNNFESSVVIVRASEYSSGVVDVLSNSWCF